MMWLRIRISASPLSIEGSSFPLKAESRHLNRPLSLKTNAVCAIVFASASVRDPILDAETDSERCIHTFATPQNRLELI